MPTIGWQPHVVLRALKGGPKTIEELAKRTGDSRSYALDCVRSLERHGWLVEREALDRFWLAPEHKSLRAA